MTYCQSALALSALELNSASQEMEPSTKEVFYRVVPSPIGPLLLAGSVEGLETIRFADDGNPARPHESWRPDGVTLDEAARQLEEYFRGERRSFDLALSARGTAFQREVWRSLRGIPYGETTTYGSIAERMGRPSAVRAVGAANGRNPVPIVVPCHRVIGKNGSLVGFAGGLRRKEALLQLEGALPAQATLGITDT